MKRRNSTIDAKTALTSTEAETAAMTFVWIVWWEDPDRSWESICLTPEECEKEYEARRADHLIAHWGKVGKRDRQSLLEWIERHVPGISISGADDFIKTAKEILRRLAAGESVPIIVRAW